MSIRPMRLYKYKSLSTSGKVEHVLDIIEKGRIYCPKFDELNDPMEGRLIAWGDAYAGIAMQVAAGKSPRNINQALGKYRILSLTSVYDSPQMWAHYADGYKGICLCIDTKDVLQGVAPIAYKRAGFRADLSLFEEYEDSDTGSDAIIKTALMFKHSDWSYEEEWRAVLDTCDIEDGLLPLPENALSAIIIGAKCDRNVITTIEEASKGRGIELYRTYIDEYLQEIAIVPYGFKYDYSGEPFGRQIERICKENGTKPFERL